MKNIVRNIGYRGALCVIGIAALTMLAMPADAAPKKKKAAKPAAAQVEQPAQPAQPGLIEISHRLPPPQAKALQDLVERFNAQNPALQLTIVEADWRAGRVPHLLILEGEEEEAFLAGKKPRYQPLAALMKKAGVALQTVKPQAMVTRRPIGANGQLLALPVGLSTPVLYVNRGAVTKAKLDPGALNATTWADLQGTLARLQQGGSRCPLVVAEPAWVFIENGSTWNNVPALRGKQAVFNGLFHVKYLGQMASWYRAKLLHVADDKASAAQRFASGECALYVGPSDAWADLRRQGVDVGVTRLPYQEETPGAPQNTLADGASLWAAAGKKPAEYKVVAQFVSFWLQPDNQVTWQRETGFLPLNRGGIFAADSSLLGEELENIRVAVGELTNRPVTSATSSQPLLENARTRQLIDQELSDVWADRKSAKAALDSATARISVGTATVGKGKK